MIFHIQVFLVLTRFTMVDLAIIVGFSSNQKVYQKKNRIFSGFVVKTAVAFCLVLQFCAFVLGSRKKMQRLLFFFVR